MFGSGLLFLLFSLFLMTRSLWRVLQRVLGGDGSKAVMMQIQACYDETYGSLTEQMESEFGGSLWKAMSYWIAPTGPAYFSGSAEVSEGDDKEMVVESWPVVVSEGTPP